MDRQIEKTVHEIVFGQNEAGELKNAVKVGEAYLYADSQHYVLKLRSLMGKLLYIRRNPDSIVDYTVFAKCIRGDGEARYDFRVGNAKLLEDLKTHLEIFIPLFQRKLFMSLYPSETVTA